MAERGKTGTHVYGSAAENQDGLIFFGKRRYNSLIKKKKMDLDTKRWVQVAYAKKDAII